MKMLERMARAAVVEDIGAPEGSELFEIHWAEFGDGYVRSIVAALKLMREPDEHMSMAGGACESAETITNADCEEIFTAMIDEVLSNEGREIFER